MLRKFSLVSSFLLVLSIATTGPQKPAQRHIATTTMAILPGDDEPVCYICDKFGCYEIECPR